MKLFRTIFLGVSVVGLVAFAVGCAITDYGGWTLHQTQGGARLWGCETASSGFDPDLDGTYSYQVNYDSRKPGYYTRIDNLHNDVFAAFSRDGIVDRDTEDTKGKAGSLTANPATPAGKFLEGWVFVDRTPGAPCEFFANETQNHLGPSPFAALCIFGAVEEVDTDLSLNAAFASADDLLKQIWSGGLTGDFTAEVSALTINGTRVELTQPASLGTTVAALRPTFFRLENSDGVQEIVNAILANTVDEQPASIGIELAGGASANLPVQLAVAFDHDAAP